MATNTTGISKINRICKAIQNLDDESIAEARVMANDQLTYNHPLKLATAARQRALGEYNAAVLDALEHLRAVIRAGGKLMTTPDNHPKMDYALLQQAITTYGIDAQLLMAVEEAGELQQALLKYRRGAHEHEAGKLNAAAMDKLLYDVLEEMADVRIMMAQMELLFGSADEMVSKKMDRLRGRLEES